MFVITENIVKHPV